MESEEKSYYEGQIDILRKVNLIVNKNIKPYPIDFKKSDTYRDLRILAEDLDYEWEEK